jgi:hypothetical protein
MSLKKEDFTDEQWAAIEAETDRRVTAASNTARKNAEKDAEPSIQAKIAEAVEAERAKLEMNEAQKLEVERQAIETGKKALAAERRTLEATKKLSAAGLSDEAIASLTPLFVNVDDKTFETTVDGFVKTHQEIVKAQVDSAKKELLANATPPAGPTGAPVDANAAAAEALKIGDAASAVDALLSAAGGTTQ